jgi:hypothetical protein
MQKLGFDAKFSEFKTQNIVGSCVVKFCFLLVSSTLVVVLSASPRSHGLRHSNNSNKDPRTTLHVESLLWAIWSHTPWPGARDRNTQTSISTAQAAPQGGATSAAAGPSTTPAQVLATPAPLTLDLGLMSEFGNCDVKFPICLEGLAYSHGQFSSYDPEVRILDVMHFLTPRVFD